MILIREDFLHYLWKYKYIVIKDLQTTSEYPIQIIKVGEHNLNSGPDFFNAHVRIGDQFWAGNVEIHVKSSDWYHHKHEYDENYNNVILHVVWINDVEIYSQNNKIIPTLELKNFVSKIQISKYQTLFSKGLKWINCEHQFCSVDQFVLNNWLEVLYFERLEKKAELIRELLHKSSNDWEAVLFKLLAKNFGLKVNGEAFLNMANSVDFKIIQKEQSNLMHLEALCFGQSGFLDEKLENPYQNQLQREYFYLKQKYQLDSLNNGQFQFFRLRPNNFPTLRLAQLSKLYFTHNNLFSKILKAEKLEDFYQLFSFRISGFWDDHYSFTSQSRKHMKKLTKSFIDLLIINTIIPLKFVYYKEIGKLNEISILDLTREIKPEKNSILTKYKSLNSIDSNSKILIENAFESQAFLQLKNNYCNSQRCLQCAVGNSILKG